jgi:small subunit ribosomal protein S20
MLTAAQDVDGRVDGGALEIRRGQYGGFVSSRQDTQEDGLEDVFGVGRIARDTQGRPENRLGVAFVQRPKPRQRGRGSHAMENRQFDDSSAGCGHVLRLTTLDARAGQRLQGGRVRGQAALTARRMVLSMFPEDTNYVASHASALKAHRQSLKNREHNRQFRARLRNALKSIRSAINGNDLSAARSALKDTISLIDRMAAKGIIHKNAAGRYKSRLTTRIAKSKAA